MATPSDAFVFFGATGDLAYKQIFPSLQGMVKAGTLDVPVIGVAKAGWDLDQLEQLSGATDWNPGVFREALDAGVRRGVFSRRGDDFVELPPEGS